MAITRKDKEEWVERGIEMGATHIISVCDTFSYEDYPIFVMPGEDPNRESRKYHNKNMQTVNEVIDLSKLPAKTDKV